MESFATIEIIMVLWKKLYYTENYGTFYEGRFTRDKNMVDYQKLRNFDL